MSPGEAGVDGVEGADRGATGGVVSRAPAAIASPPSTVCGVIAIGVGVEHGGCGGGGAASR